MGAANEVAPKLVWRDVLEALMFGAVAGTCAKTVVAPLDRVKILMQVKHDPTAADRGLLQTTRLMWEREKIRGLLKGNSAQIMRIIPYAGLQFAVYNAAHRQYKLPSFISGACAGTVAVLATYPFDALRARMAWQLDRRFVSVSEMFTRVWQAEGFRGLYRGAVPTLIGIVPYGGTNFFVNEQARKWAATFVKKDSQSQTPARLPVPAQLACGALAGAVGQTVVYPLDTVRRRMQVQATPFSGTIEGILYIARTEGIVKGLYRGLSLNYIRSVPTVAITFTIFDLLKSHVGGGSTTKVSMG